MAASKYKDEIIWVSYHDKSGNQRYIITSKAAREYYFIYRCDDEKYVKLGRGKNPAALEREYIPADVFVKV